MGRSRSRSYGRRSVSRGRVRGAGGHGRGQVRQGARASESRCRSPVRRARAGRSRSAGRDVELAQQLGFAGSGQYEGAKTLPKKLSAGPRRSPHRGSGNGQSSGLVREVIEFDNSHGRSLQQDFGTRRREEGVPFHDARAMDIAEGARSEGGRGGYAERGPGPRGQGNSGIDSFVEPRHSEKGDYDNYQQLRGKDEGKGGSFADRDRAPSTSEVFWKFFKYEEVAPNSSSERIMCQEKLVDWMTSQSEISMQRCQLVTDICERLVMVGVFSVSRLTALPLDDLLDTFLDERSCGVNSALCGRGHPSRLLLQRAHEVANTHFFNGESQSAVDLVQQQVQSFQHSGSDIAAALKPFLSALTTSMEVQSSSHRKLAKAFEAGGARKGSGRGSKIKDSHSDTEDEFQDKDRVKLGPLLATDRCYDEGVVHFIQSHWFCEAQRLGRCKRKAKRDDTKVPHAFKSDTSDWTPSWVFLGRRTEEKKKLEQSRQERVRSNPAAFLGNLASELLNLYGIGELPLVAVLSKLLLSIRMVDERGLEYARTYHTAEKDSLAEKAKFSKHCDMGLYISGDANERIMKDLDKVFPGSAFSDILEAPVKGRIKIGEREPAESKRSRSPRRHTQNFVAATQQGKEEGQWLPVCFQEDARKNLKCAAKTKGVCKRDHLDTTNADQAARFDKAYQGFVKIIEKNKERKSKRAVSVKKDNSA